MVFAADGSSFLYARLDDNHRARSIWRHLIGTSTAQDRLVFEESAPGWFVSVHRERMGRHASIAVRDHETSEAFIVDLERPDAPPRLVAPREAGVRYEIEIGGNRVFIRTNRDGAEDFKIVEAPLEAPGPESWRDVVAHRPGVMVLRHAIFARHLAWLERENGLPRLVIRALADGTEHAVAFDEEAYALSLDAGEEFDTDILRFTLSTPARPAETYDYDMASRERILVKRQLIPSGHDPDAYVVRRLFAEAPDGETIPVTLLHRRDLALDGSAPCLLYGYGAYGSPVLANFLAHRLSLVDRGMVYALAHVRGGTEKGWRWYTQGKRAEKENSFSDYLCVARMLIEKRYTAAGRIVANGRSAGGMLMGVAANREPELFAGIVTEVPFVDVLVTMLDADLPLTPPEWPEWGNPLVSESDFRTILAYSPVENVEPSPLPGDPRDRRPRRPARHLLGAGEMGRKAARQFPFGKAGAFAHRDERRTYGGARPLRPPRGVRLDPRLRSVGLRPRPRRRPHADRAGSARAAPRFAGEGLRLALDKDERKALKKRWNPAICWPSQERSLSASISGSSTPQVGKGTR